MPSNSPLSVLRNYATLQNPDRSLPANVLLMCNPNTIVIFDAYPKAKYHFLVLPRYPFPSLHDPESRHSIVTLGQLDDLRSLMFGLPGDTREEVLIGMEQTAREVEEMIRDEMMKTEGFMWKVDVGFHAVPSIKHLHLHVISDDRLSPCLKTKRHYNSFRPDLGFFLPIMEVQRWFHLGDEYIHERVGGFNTLDTLLASPLCCWRCDEPFGNVSKLKSHLEKEFIKDRDRALREIRRHGTQQTLGGDEELL